MFGGPLVHGFLCVVLGILVSGLVGWCLGLGVSFLCHC